MKWHNALTLSLLFGIVGRQEEGVMVGSLLSLLALIFSLWSIYLMMFPPRRG